MKRFAAPLLFGLAAFLAMLAFCWGVMGEPMGGVFAGFVAAGVAGWLALPATSAHT